MKNNNKYNFNVYNYPKNEKARLSGISVISLIVVGLILLLVIVMALGISKSKKKAEKEGNTVYEQIADTDNRDTTPFGKSVANYLEDTSNIQVQITVANTSGNDAYFLGKLAPYYQSSYVSIIGTITEQQFEGWLIAENGTKVEDYSNYTGDLPPSQNKENQVYFYIDETGTYVRAKYIFENYNMRPEIEDKNLEDYAWEHYNLFTGNELFRIDEGCSGKQIKEDLIDSFRQIESKYVKEAKTSNGLDAVEIVDGGLSYIFGSKTKDIIGGLHGDSIVYAETYTKMQNGHDRNCLRLRGVGDDLNFSIEFCDDNRFLGIKEDLSALSMDEYLDRVKEINEKYNVTPIT